MKPPGSDFFQTEAASDYVDLAIIALHAQELDVKSLASLFIEAKNSSENLLKNLLAACETGAYRDVAATSHSLAGLAANYGLVRLKTLAMELKTLSTQTDIEPLTLDNCLGDIQAVHTETFKAVAHLFAPFSGS